MAQDATHPILSACKHADDETNAVRTFASLITRSLEDLRLAERIERGLHATGYSPLRDIEVFVNARIVHLTGRVPSYYLKQVAQVTVLAIPGTHALHNDVDVIPLT